MAQYGVTPQGFRRKTLQEIKAEVEDALRGEFGNGINLQAQSFFGQLVGIIVDREDKAWQLAEDTYNSQYPDSATGVNLDNANSVVNVTRLGATKSQVEILCDGTPATVLPAGRVMSNPDTGDRFTSKADATIGGGGDVLVEFEAEEAGPIEALAGTITQIETPVGGWAGGTNPEDAAPGRETETDGAYKIRRAASLQNIGGCTVDAIRARLQQLDGVLYADVAENIANQVDVDGRPPHSIEAIVQGGDPAEIAQLLWDQKPGGIQTYGAESDTATDALGNPQTVNFSRPVEREITVEIDVTPAPLGEVPQFPAGGDAQIKTAVLAYGQAFANGQDVVPVAFHPTILQTPGVVGIAVRISVDAGPLVTVPIPISAREIAEFDSARITVTVL